MNPSAPSIKGLIKIHKTDQPIHPVINWCNASAQKLSKLFTEKSEPTSTFTPLLQHKEHPRPTEKPLRHPHAPTLQPSLSRHHQLLFQHSSKRDQDDFRQHSDTT